MSRTTAGPDLGIRLDPGSLPVAPRPAAPRRADGQPKPPPNRHADVLGPILGPVDAARRRLDAFTDNFWSHVGLWAPLDESQHVKHRDEALRRLDYLPSKRELSEWIPAFVNASDATATRKQIILLIALMIDSFPSVRAGDLDTYTDALVYVAHEDDIEFSNYVIARTVVYVIRNFKWPPSPMEFLDLAKKEQRQFCLAYNKTLKLFDHQDNAFWIAVFNKDREDPYTGEEIDDLPF
jgi:hypothetical protein